MLGLLGWLRSNWRGRSGWNRG